MIKVLLVEDHIKISQNIVSYLNDTFEVQPVYSAEDALLYLNAYSYDLVILDLMLPGKDGLSVLSYIEEKHLVGTGVIILTAKEDLGEKLKAFCLGAHDYLTKPFFMEELKARMQVILKSLGKIATSNTLVFKDLRLNMAKKEALLHNQVIPLNEKLYSLLEYLILNKNVILFKEQIFERLCGYDSDATIEIVEVYMSRLRKVLNPYGYDQFIVTKRGMGYILDEQKEA